MRNPNDADRDEWIYDALLRTGYFVSPRINAFVEGRYNIEKRDRNEDFGGVERDSEGWGASVGAEVDLTNLLVGEFSVGYRQQSFEQDGFDDEDGVGYGIDLTYTPTLLTTVRLGGGGDFRPTSSSGSDAESNFRSYARSRGRPRAVAQRAPERRCRLHARRVQRRSTGSTTRWTSVPGRAI